MGKFKAGSDTGVLWGDQRRASFCSADDADGSGTGVLFFLFPVSSVRTSGVRTPRFVG